MAALQHATILENASQNVLFWSWVLYKDLKRTNFVILFFRIFPADITVESSMIPFQQVILLNSFCLRDHKQQTCITHSKIIPLCPTKLQRPDNVDRYGQTRLHTNACAIMTNKNVIFCLLFSELHCSLFYIQI